MVAMAKRRVWPSDAVIVVCATPKAAITAKMESVNPVKCRECGIDLVADGKTIRHAQEHPQRMGRPVAYLCIGCSTKYDVNSVDHLIDDR
jgi:hypothetical protein